MPRRLSLWALVPPACSPCLSQPLLWLPGLHLVSPPVPVQMPPLGPNSITAEAQSPRVPTREQGPEGVL